MSNARNVLGTVMFAASLFFSGMAAEAQDLTITIPGGNLDTLDVTATEESAEDKLLKAKLLSDRLAEQIRTLIRIALITGDSGSFQSAIYDLTVKFPELAPNIASFTTSAIIQHISAPTTRASAKVTPEIIQSITIAATVATATAVPEKFQEIVAATAKVIAAATAPAPATATETTETAASDEPTGEKEALDPATLAEMALVQKAVTDVFSNQAALMETIKTQVETSLIEKFDDPSITAETLIEMFPASDPATDLAETPTTESASPAG